MSALTRHPWKKYTSFASPALVILLVVIIVFLSSHLWHHDVLFHTDVARDFLVMEQIVATKKPTLIGPRSGGIEGVFHGPLWYYVSLPAFILTQGDPVLMGWFWWLIGVAAVILFFIFLYRETKTKTTSLLLTIAYTVLLLPSAAGPINTYLADLLSFSVFYCWLCWFRYPTLKTASLAWFTLGLLVQFQMAFALPLAIALFPLFSYRTYQKRAILHMCTVLLFFIPLASFVLFDIRHNFLQTKSIFSHISTSFAVTPSEQTTSRSILLFGQLLLQRLKQLMFEGTNVFGFVQYLNPIFLSLLIFLGWQSSKTQPNTKKTLTTTLLFISYMYFSWWLITLGFSGTIWTYYFSPFFSIVLFVIGMTTFRSQRAILLLALTIPLLIFQSKDAFFYTHTRFNSSSWKLLSSIAAEALSESNRGYFLYSQNQLAYPLKYAFLYHQQQHPDIITFPFVKKPKTVLVKGEDNPNNPYSTAQDWQLNKVSINQSPDKTMQYSGYTVELFHLNQQSIDAPVDPHLIQDLHFR